MLLGSEREVAPPLANESGYATGPYWTWATRVFYAAVKAGRDLWFHQNGSILGLCRKLVSDVRSCVGDVLGPFYMLS